jgi:DNA-binding transcriptional MerR regulator
MSRTYQPHEFAQRAGVTIRALHHYDRLGLLKPSGRTAAGYRLYSDRDLVRLEQIVALKFIGFPLSQIRELLNHKDLGVTAELRQQRRILVEKREHLNRAIRAIERAEQAVASGGHTDWEPFRKIIEVIQMQTRKDWMKKYYTEEQLENLRKRWTPEVQAESQRAWINWLGTPKRPSLAGKTHRAKSAGSLRGEGSACWISSLAAIRASRQAWRSSTPTGQTGPKISKSLTAMRSINSFARRPNSWKKRSRSASVWNAAQAASEAPRSSCLIGDV